MATLLPEGKQSFTDGSGMPLVGGKLYTYDAGTSTPRPTYSDAAATTQNTNPVVLDARGEATVFWKGAYKVVLKDSAGTTVWTVDNVDTPVSSTELASSASGKGAEIVGVSLVGGSPTNVKAVLQSHDTKLQNLDTALNFSTLPVASSPVADADLMVLRQGGANKQLPVSVVRAEFATNAVAAAAGAVAAKTAAETAKTAAEAARDATVVGAAPTVYDTTAAGLAATTSGKYFSVPSADSAEYLILYLNNAGTAVEQKRYPSVSAFDSIYRERFQASRANFLASNVERANYSKRAAILVLVGQSNNVPRGAPISGSVSPDVMMPAGGNSMTYWPYNSTNAEWVAKYSDVASAITDAQGAAENPGSGAALAMLGGTFSRIYMCSVALGSSSFTRLQSTGPIANCNAVISRLCDIARADGFEPYVVFDTHHGETGASNGDSEATYYSQGWTYYRQIQAFAAHAMRRTDYDAPILFHMPVAYGTFGTAPNMRNVAKAIVRLARDIPGGIMLGGSYQFPITDGVHQSNVGMRKKGELAGQLLRDYFAQRATFQALQMVDAVLSGTTVTVTFNKEIVYDTTLTFGTSLNATNALGGFEFTDDGAFIKINAISVQGRNAVLTLNAAPAGTTKLVQIASQEMTGSPTTFQLTAGSQIRANATAPLSIYDYTTPFYDMAAPQVLQVRT